jgi:hypothetical protein
LFSSFGKQNRLKSALVLETLELKFNFLPQSIVALGRFDPVLNPAASGCMQVTPAQRYFRRAFDPEHTSTRDIRGSSVQNRLPVFAVRAQREP